MNEPHTRHQKSPELIKSYLILCSIFTTTISIIWIISIWQDIPHRDFIFWALSTPVQAIAIWTFYKETRATTQQKSAGTKNTDLEILVAAGTSTAYAYSAYGLLIATEQTTQYFGITAILITMMLAGKQLDTRTEAKTPESIEKLKEESPKTAIVIRGGKDAQTPIEDVMAGDRIIIKPGQRIPIDGTITAGHSQVDESMLTGQNGPVEKNKEDHVLAGTLNKQGSFELKAAKAGANTSLSQIIHLVEETQRKKDSVEKDTRSTPRRATIIVAGISIATFISWYYISTLPFALNMTASVLIISVPGAIALAAPAAIMAGIRKGAKEGIIIKNRDAIETAHEIRSIAIEKTGTLTKGYPEITDIVPIAASSDEIIRIGASIGKKTNHPLAEAMIKKAKEKEIKTIEISKYKITPGAGASARIGTKTYHLGNNKLMDEAGLKIADHLIKIQSLEDEGKTVMIIADNKKISGLIAIADPIKPSSPTAVQQLQNMGIQVYLMTGDDRRIAKAIARKTGISNIFSEVRPADKADIISELQKKGKTAMVGAGINDAPALAQADIGITTGSTTEAAKETSNIILLNNDPMDVPKALRLSKLTVAKKRQNIFWASAYNAAGIIIATGALYQSTGWLMSPTIAAGAIALSSASVAINSIIFAK